MKACVLEAVGKLEYKDVPLPVIQKDEVLLKINACGICSSDIDRIFKTGTYHFPTIPGHEFSGIIVKTGEKVDSNLLGKHATAFPLKPCFACPSCRKRAYARCDNYDYYGSRCDGAFAEYLAVKVWNLVCYENISDENAAMCEPASVALHAIEQANIKDSDTVVVIGTGTIGCLAAMWCTILRAKQVILVGRNSKKVDYIRKMEIPGISVLNQNTNDFCAKLQAMTENNMADVVVECVGSSEALKNALLYTRKGGTIILVGNPIGEMTLDKVTYWKILRNELKIKGVWNSDYHEENNNWKKTLQAMQTGQLDVSKLITHIYSMDQYKEAFRTVMDSEKISIKVMLKNKV